eukprot:3322677-Alexandrium_andersonii.AAC.1
MATGRSPRCARSTRTRAPRRATPAGRSGRASGGAGRAAGGGGPTRTTGQNGQRLRRRRPRSRSASWWAWR